MMTKLKVSSEIDLDQKLREFGTSIAKQRKAFTEQVLSREVLRQNVNYEPDVSHVEMVKYYREHVEDYQRQAQARWEELAVRFENYDSKREGYQSIAQMGNRVLRGAAFSRVAREQSEGFTAEEGGWHDWTTKGSLRSQALNHAIFALEPDQLSEIIEDENGFHIIRVLDRQEEGISPFFKEQVRIKQILKKQKIAAQIEAYQVKVRDKVRVWTIFDDAHTAAKMGPSRQQ